MAVSAGGRKTTGSGSHLYCIGRTRSGKSWFLAGLIISAFLNGVTIILIDPNADLYNQLLAYMAVVTLKWPQLSRHIILVNPLDPDWSHGLNPLQIFPGEVLERKALFLTDNITKVFHDDPAIVVLLRRVMRNAFTALMELGLTLNELPRFLSEREFRETLVSNHIQNPLIRRFWFEQFPQNERDADQWIRSTLNRLESIVYDPDYRLLFGRQEGTINLQDIINDPKPHLLMFNTSKGELGDENSRLLGSFIVAQTQQTIMTRATIPKAKRRPVLLVLDEFQNYVSPSITTLLEETAKYNLSAVLSHQHLAQLRDEALQASVLSQCNDYVSFGIGESDAKTLAPLFFRPELNQAKHIQMKPANWGNDVVLPFEDITWRPLVEILEIEKRKFLLKPRYFWHLRLGSEAVLYKSHDLPEPVVPPALIQRLVDSSGARYAIPKDLARRHVEDEREKLLADLIGRATGGYHTMSGRTTVPFWDEN